MAPCLSCTATRWERAPIVEPDKGCLQRTNSPSQVNIIEPQTSVLAGYPYAVPSFQPSSRCTKKCSSESDSSTPSCSDFMLTSANRLRIFTSWDHSPMPPSHMILFKTSRRLTGVCTPTGLRQTTLPANFWKKEGTSESGKRKTPCLIVSRGRL